MSRLHTYRVAGLTVALAAASLAFAGEGKAQSSVNFGPEIAWGDKNDLAIGARLSGDLTLSQDGILESLRGIAEFLYYLDPYDSAVCDDCGLWELNLNGALPFRLGDSTADFYAGAGLNIARFTGDPILRGEFDDTDLGLNVLGGLNFDLGSLDSFAEVNVRLGGSEQIVLVGGITLG